MNTRRVHELMKANFPEVAAAEMQWTYIADKHRKLLPEEGKALVEQHFLDRGIGEVLVQVHRKLGGRMPTADLMNYIALHMGEGNIRIADRDFSVFSLISTNGAASSWSKS